MPFQMQIIAVAVNGSQNDTKLIASTDTGSASRIIILNENSD